MKSSIKANYQETYDKTRIEFVNMISDPDSREKFLQTCPTAQSLRSAANRARTQMVPVAPKSFHDVDFTLMEMITPNTSSLRLYILKGNMMFRHFCHYLSDEGMSGIKCVIKHVFDVII